SGFLSVGWLKRSDALGERGVNFPAAEPVPDRALGHRHRLGERLHRSRHTPPLSHRSMMRWSSAVGSEPCCVVMRRTLALNAVHVNDFLPSPTGLLPENWSRWYERL